MAALNFNETHDSPAGSQPLILSIRIRRCSRAAAAQVDILDFETSTAASQRIQRVGHHGDGCSV
jgi:hypothetical protein